MVTDLFLLQQRQGVGQQSHPEASGGDLGRHEGEQQLSRLAEALLSVQLVELSVLPYGWQRSNVFRLRHRPKSILPDYNSANATIDVIIQYRSAL